MERNQVIVELREHGKTLQEIGDLVGLTRERVRQILEERNGNVKLITCPMLAEELGVGVQTLYNFLERVGIERRYYWQSHDITLVKYLFAKNHACRMCGQPVGPHRWVYCSDECCRKVQEEDSRYRARKYYWDNRDEVRRKLREKKLLTNSKACGIL